jgi:DNA-binding CsgD family transcriptional regulator
LTDSVLANYVAAIVVAIASYSENRRDRLSQVKQFARFVLQKKICYGLEIQMRAALGLAAVMESDGAVAREQYGRMKRGEHNNLVLTSLTVDRVLGLLAATFGDDSAARNHLEDAMSRWEAKGLRLELAWVCFSFASLLLGSTSHSDRARGADLLNRSLALSQEMGLRLLHERAISLRDRVLPLARRTASFGGLSEREVEVLTLLAAGKTDRAIADALSISVRTVSNHVSSILAKTGTANRTEVAAYALRHGIR